MGGAPSARSRAADSRSSGDALIHNRTAKGYDQASEHVSFGSRGRSRAFQNPSFGPYATGHTLRAGVALECTRTKRRQLAIAEASLAHHPRMSVGIEPPLAILLACPRIAERLPSRRIGFHEIGRSDGTTFLAVRTSLGRLVARRGRPSGDRCSPERTGHETASRTIFCNGTTKRRG